ncbi:hypothetical protein FOZ61_003891 [Perkinsus olseni]|uniref:Cilia- and flagella-associated protein 53 n=1 Tax=Perkinsus olseni TaxID=32597 RepID=A0A7J6LMT7_PEROL|nr:hypothetical protein FOZ61_003891 [Perkinsus olseni]
MIDDFLESLQPVVSDSESSDTEDRQVEDKPVSARVYGREELESVERLLVCTSLASSLRCGIEGLPSKGRIDVPRVDYVPTTSDAVLTVPTRYNGPSLKGLVWGKLRPKEVVVAITKEVSSTRGEDGIVYTLGDHDSGDQSYQPLPLGEAVDGPVAGIITGAVARKIPVAAYILYHGPHPGSSAILKLAAAVSSHGKWNLSLKKVHDGFIKLSPSLDNRVSVYMYEERVSAAVESSSLQKLAEWENKGGQLYRKQRVNACIADLRKRRQLFLHHRRAKLSELLKREEAMYAQELEDRRETSEQQNEKLRERALKLKAEREEERMAIAKEKEYQRWRASLDELRQADHELFALEVVATRDQQLTEKEDVKKMEKEEEAIYDRLWQEGYKTKVVRELAQEQIKAARTALAKETLDEQMKLKKAEEKDKSRALEQEREYMKSVWKEVEDDKRRTVEEAAAKNIEDRRRMDEYALQTKRARDAEKEREKQQDRQFILNVLASEKKLAEKEAMERALRMKQEHEFNEALKAEMALRAKSGEELARLEDEEAERQWQKRFAQWEAEREARLELLKEVYEDREKQVELHDRLRQRRKEEVEGERRQIDADVEEFYKLAEERKVFEETAVSPKAQEGSRDWIQLVREDPASAPLDARERPSIGHSDCLLVPLQDDGMEKKILTGPGRPDQLSDRARKEHAQTLARQMQEAREKEAEAQREIERELEEQRRRDEELAAAIAVEKERQKGIEREIFRHRQLRRQEASSNRNSS